MINRLKWLTLMALMSCLFSCGDEPVEEQSGVSMKQQVIKALNADEADKALGMAIAGEHSHPNDPEFTYYKAQAYSLKAKIDIYTLFPIVQMQVFDVAINEWNKANEFEKRRRDSINISILGEEDRDRKFETDELLRAEIKRLKEMSDEDISKIELNLKITYVYEYVSSWGSDNQEYTCSVSYTSHADILPKGHSGYKSYIQVTKGDKTCEEAALAELEKYKESMKRNVHGYSIYQFEEKLKRITQRRSQERYIKSALALFDSIPILKKIPIIEQENFQHLYHALDVLNSLHTTLPKDSRLWKNVYQQMGLLGGYLLTFSIKDSVDLEGVKSPYDIICKADAKKLVGNYRHLLAGGRTLLSATIDSSFYEKNKENMDKAIELIDQAPDSLSDEQKEEFIDDIFDFQADNC